MVTEKSKSTGEEGTGEKGEGRWIRSKGGRRLEEETEDTRE